MKNYFECKLSYDKTLESGITKKVTEPYLVEALSFTEAEARINEEMKEYISVDFTITDIKKARLSEIFFNQEGDRFYKAKVQYLSLDEKSGNEKKTSATMLVQASNLEEAFEKLKDGMEGTLSKYNTASISESPIIDIFKD